MVPFERPMPSDTVSIEVSSDPSVVAEALRLGQRRAPLVERALEDGSLHEDSPPVRAALAEDPDALFARLAALAEDANEPARRRATAARILAAFGRRRGLDLLVGLVTSEARDLRRAALFGLEPHLSHPPLREAVMARLDDPDHEVRQLALWLAARTDLRDGLAPASVSFLRERLLADLDYSTTWVLGSFLRSGLAGAARSALREYAEQRRHGRFWDGVVDVLAAQPDPEDEALLRAIVADTGDPYRSGVALCGLARLLGEEAVPLILPQLEDARRAVAAVEALGLAAAGTGRPDVVAAIRSAHLDYRGPRRVMYALLRVDGPAGRQALVEYVRTLGCGPLERFDVMNAVWVLRGIDPVAAIGRLAALGIVEADARGAGFVPEAEQLRLQPYAVAFGQVAARHVVAFYDAEASQVPCGHETVVFRLAEVSRGVFQPDGVREDFVAAERGGGGRYRLTFVNAGRVYQVSFDNENDYYHPSAVTDGANRALRDAGRPEQFLRLSTSDQMAAWLFAVPDQARQAAAELLLLLDDDQPLQRAIDELGP